MDRMLDCTHWYVYTYIMNVADFSTFFTTARQLLLDTNTGVIELHAVYSGLLYGW